jgi:CBS domain-containing protein
MEVIVQTLRQIMTRNVDFTAPNTSITEAAEKMRKHEIGALPICDANRIHGIITDRDIVVRALAEHRDPNQTPVSDIMSRDIVLLNEEDSIQDAAKLMKQKNLRRLMVVDRDNRLSGIVSVTDLATKGKGELSQEVLDDITALMERSETVRMFRRNLRGTWVPLVFGSALISSLFFLFRNQPEFRRGVQKAISKTKEQRFAA